MGASMGAAHLALRRYRLPDRFARDGADRVTERVEALLASSWIGQEGTERETVDAASLVRPKPARGSRVGYATCSAIHAAVTLTASSLVYSGVHPRRSSVPIPRRIFLMSPFQPRPPSTPPVYS